MAPIRSTTLLAVFVFLLCYSESFSKRSNAAGSRFSCGSNNEHLFWARVCDGTLDCSNGHDENGACSDEGSLIYYTYLEELLHHSNVTSDGEYEYSSGQTYGHHYINVNVIYLNDAERYSFAFLNESFEEKQMVTRNGFFLDNIQINWEGPQLDVYYLKHKKRKRIDPSFFYWRAAESQSNYSTNLERIRVLRENFASEESVRPGTHVTDSIRFRVASMKNLVYDWITSNIYCILDSKIKVCDKDFIICVDLPTKFAESPTFLAISHYERLLLWFEEENSERFHLYKYALNDTTKAKRISIGQRIRNPMWLTVDSMRNRIYWMCIDDHDHSNNVTFGSIMYDGTDEKMIQPNKTISYKTSSFAVFKDIIYWPETEEGFFIWACRVMDNCSNPYVFTPAPHHYMKPTKAQKFKLGSLMINHRPISSDKIKNPCANAACSHLCVPESETAYQCYCEHQPKAILEDQESGFCENITLLITNGNSLYIIGLLEDGDRYPMIRQFSVNISSISAAAYNSNEGSVFLAEKGTQRLYEWSPRTKELQLLIDDGPGTIRLIRYDNYGNNLYWIDPANYAIKVMNMDSSEMMILLKGDSSYSPFDLILIPQRKHMIVLFSNNNKEFTMEQVSMDGKPESRMILYTDLEADGPDNVFLHYVRPFQLIAMLDKQINKIRYLYLTKESTLMQYRYYAGFQSAIVEGDPGKIESMTTVGKSLIWLDDKLTIHRVPFDNNPQVSLSIFGEQNIDLGLKRLNDTILNLVAVESYREELQTECFKSNGHCEELCLLADNYKGYSCLCTKNAIMLNETHCNHATTKLLEEYTLPSMSTETETTMEKTTQKTTNPLPNPSSSKENQTFSTAKAIRAIPKTERRFTMWEILRICLLINIILCALYIFRKKLRKYLSMIILRFRGEHQYLPERLDENMYDGDGNL